MFDIQKIREDFSILRDKKAPIYFDNACMSLKPDSVVSALDEYYKNYPACVGRSPHKLSEIATRKVKEARVKIANFIGAKSEKEIIFTRNTTEGLNLLANSFPFIKGDVVLLTNKEHNSNLIPWLLLKKKIGIEIRIVGTTQEGFFDLEDFKNKIKGARLVSFVHTANLDGTQTPIKEIVKIAHENQALVCVDIAQTLLHERINVVDLDLDFVSFSGHKILGPTGTGAFYGKMELLQRLNLFLVGGNTVANSTYEDFELLPPPERFEAGLMNYAEIIGFGQAVEYLSSLDFEKIKEYEYNLNKYISEEISKFEKVKIIGPKDAKYRTGIISFYIENQDMHQIAVMLDQMAGICVRSGRHCVHSWFNKHNIQHSLRISLAFYNTKKEAEIFVENFNKIMKII